MGWLMDKQLEAKFLEAWKRLEKSHGTFKLEIGFSELLALVGNVQLALRHPGNKGETARIARNLLDAIIASVAAQDPFCAQMLRLGFDERHDVPREP